MASNSGKHQSQAKLVHLIRHGQAYHNVGQRLDLRDPALTEIGENQCRGLREKFPYQSSATLLVTSPLTRTVQTMLIALAPAVKRGVTPIVASQLFQENGDWLCDIGTESKELEAKFSGEPVDFSQLEEPWPLKTGLYEPGNAEERAKKARAWLAARDEDEIVVTCHGGFLHYLTDDWAEFDESLGTAWENTEFRSYSLSLLDCKFTETQESKDRRSKKITHGNGITENREIGSVEKGKSKV